MYCCLLLELNQNFKLALKLKPSPATRLASQHLAFETEVAVRFQMARIIFGPYLAERDGLCRPFRAK